MADHGGQRKTVGERFAKNGEIRCDAGKRLITTRTQPKSRLHLVKDEHSLEYRGELARSANPFVGWHSFDDGLDDDRGELIASIARRLIEGVPIVERHGTKEAAYRVRHSRRIARPIVPSEVPAADDEITTRVGAGDTNRGGDALGATLQELHQLGAGNVVAQSLRQLDLVQVRETGDVAGSYGVKHTLLNIGLRVSEGDRSEGHRAVDVRPARRIDDATSARADVVCRSDGIGITVQRLSALAACRRTGRKDGVGPLAPIDLRRVFGRGFIILARRVCALFSALRLELFVGRLYLVARRFILDSRRVALCAALEEATEGHERKKLAPWGRVKSAQYAPDSGRSRCSSRGRGRAHARPAWRGTGASASSA